jgi:hypothetical protein
VAVTGGLALLVYAVVDAVNVGWGATRTIVCLTAAVALLIAFVAIELHQRDPLMPFSIFRLRTAGAILAAVLISSRDSHQHSNAARTGEAARADGAAVPVPAV